MMSQFTFIDVQGFKHANKFILKEIYIKTKNKGFHAIITSPFEFKQTNLKFRQEIKWVTNNYHGINWNDGNISLSTFVKSVESVLKGKVVLCKGCEKVKWIKTIFSGIISDCKNLEDEGCNVKPHECDKNDKQFTCMHHQNMTAHCAIKNVDLLENWVINNKLII